MGPRSGGQGLQRPEVKGARGEGTDEDRVEGDAEQAEVVLA